MFMFLPFRSGSIDKYIQKLIQELINFESPKATITQRPHMKQPQTSLKEKPSWSLFRGTVK